MDIGDPRRSCDRADGTPDTNPDDPEAKSWIIVRAPTNDICSVGVYLEMAKQGSVLQCYSTSHDPPPDPWNRLPPHL